MLQDAGIWGTGIFFWKTWLFDFVHTTVAGNCRASLAPNWKSSRDLKRFEMISKACTQWPKGLLISQARLRLSTWSNESPKSWNSWKAIKSNPGLLFWNKFVAILLKRETFFYEIVSTSFYSGGLEFFQIDFLPSCNVLIHKAFSLSIRCSLGRELPEQRPLQLFYQWLWCFWGLEGFGKAGDWEWGIVGFI